MNNALLVCLVFTFSQALQAEEWWSRKPLVEPKVPEAKEWVRNEVDRFILAKLKANGLRSSKEASPLALVRRVTYDLTGLPPTPKEMEEFLEAYQELT